MINLYSSKGKCSGCTACYNECKLNAITMVSDDEGFLYPYINNSLCVECNACVNICPFKEKDNNSLYPENQKIYGLKHKSDLVRKSSASGGAFTAISDYVINNDGIVFGAIFDDCFNVIHDQALTFETRNKMKGSKYVQSCLGDIFINVKKQLINKKMVLFTGTPCQVDGLKSFLKKDYENLFTCDIACHGVTSPKVWDDYKEIIQNRYNDTIDDVVFRCKDNGWKKSSLKIKLHNSVYMQSMQEDPYYILFFNHINIRPSCYKCIYTTYHRVSDITIADFWGIEKMNSDFDDDLGVSLIFSNSSKGNDLINKIDSDVSLINSDYKHCYQTVFDKPCKKPALREEFWSMYRLKPREAILKFGRLTIIDKIIKKIIVPILKTTGLYNVVLKIYVNRT